MDKLVADGAAAARDNPDLRSYRVEADVWHACPAVASPTTSDQTHKESDASTKDNTIKDTDSDGRQNCGLPWQAAEWLLVPDNERETHRNKERRGDECPKHRGFELGFVA
jgi:hypothetical protein